MLFSKSSDWFLKLINFLKKHRHINVIIRPHPAEKVFECEDNIEKLFKKSFKTIPKNIKMLDTKSTINTYGLINASDLILTYTSDVGWESVLRKKPTIDAGKGPSWGKNITIDQINKVKM